MRNDRSALINSQIDVSIIIPVYNAELFIGKCIESILMQKYESWELILIDDCSTDRSLQICNAYACKNNKIIVLQNDRNRGVGYSRNKGIDAAVGKFIVFLDADDWCDDCFLSNGMKLCEEKQLDMYLSGYRRIDIEKNLVNSNAIPEQIDIVSDLPSEKEMEMLLRYNYVASCTGNIIKKSFIGKNRFSQTMIWGEDLCFMFGLLSHPLNLVASQDIYYNYRAVQNSLTSVVSQLKCENFIKTYTVLFEYGTAHGLKEGVYQQWIEKRMIFDYVTIQKMILKSEKSIRDQYQLLKMLGSDPHIREILKRSCDKYVRRISMSPLLTIMYHTYLNAKNKKGGVPCQH